MKRYGHPKLNAWKTNELLAKADYLAHNKIKGPETIVFDRNGSLYSGLSNGQIVRIDKNGQIEKIIQVGEEMDERVCGKNFN
jgi:hypothetical protein